MQELQPRCLRFKLFAGRDGDGGARSIHFPVTATLKHGQQRLGYPFLPIPSMCFSHRLARNGSEQLPVPIFWE